ncbi:InlB B-repeat-containing protein, partial [Ralstonia pseudosolanacearum]|uniref:InlB B-repeat-containing protein n=1 Tax=Ralstonia pseudosolanacearum TaxID=1310165 RepID=UPI003D17632E
SATTTLTSSTTTTYTYAGLYQQSGLTTLVANTSRALQASTTYTDANSKWTYTTASAVTLYAKFNSSTGNYSAVTLPTITRTGSTCGWSTSSTATTISYASGASFTPTGNTTLYGVCVNNITLNNSGATTAGSLSATVNYNATALSTITLPQRKYTVSGFAKDSSASSATVSSTSSLTNTADFNGWYTASSGGTKIAAGG